MTDRPMTLADGLAFIFRQSWAFLSWGWWLALLAGLPSVIGVLVWWSLAEPPTAPFVILDGLTALLDAYVFIVVVRSVASELPPLQALKPGLAGLQRCLPYIVFSTIYGLAQSYLIQLDTTDDTYWLAVIIGNLLNILISCWAVGMVIDAPNRGLLRMVRTAVPQLFWALPLFLLLEVLVQAGFYLIQTYVLPGPDLEIGGLTIGYTGYGLQMLVLTSIFMVAVQVAMIATARRAGVGVPSEDAELRDTFG
jgi:hypothetical protein